MFGRKGITLHTQWNGIVFSKWFMYLDGFMYGTEVRIDCISMLACLTASTYLRPVRRNTTSDRALRAVEPHITRLLHSHRLRR